MDSALVIFSPISLSFFAQNSGAIRGFLYNKENGEPVIFSNVFLKGTTIGANTDLNGFFSITKIPPGDYTLMITNLDFDTIAEKITIKAKTTLAVSLLLRPLKPEIHPYLVVL